MLIQVVHSHPLADSYNHALFHTIVETLKPRHEVIATDLYREGFSPEMTETERRSYYHGPYAEDAVASLIGHVRRADGIIFCFPHWWFSMPAMLKGYFDRVWAPGTAFAHDLKGGRIKPLLTNIRLFGVVTSYGSPWWLSRIVMQDPGRKVLLRALKPMCGPASGRSIWRTTIWIAPLRHPGLPSSSVCVPESPKFDRKVGHGAWPRGPNLAEGPLISLQDFRNDRTGGS